MPMPKFEINKKSRQLIISIARWLNPDLKQWQNTAVDVTTYRLEFWLRKRLQPRSYFRKFHPMSTDVPNRSEC